jgi:preprotein translocase subunit YajC
MTATLTLTQMTAAIAAGAADDHFDFVYDAIRQRRGVLSSARAAQFAPGDTVMFNGEGTRYLAGVKAIVQRVNAKTITVDVEVNPQARQFSGARGVRTDATMVTKIEGQANLVAPLPAPPVNDISFSEGDRVRFVSGRPKYLVGVQGTVCKINDKTVGVNIDQDPRARTFSGAQGIRVPITVLALVD